MEALEAIFTRRSIRKYSSKKIPPEIVEQLLSAAMHAPSARNCQPWHFIVIDKRDILDKIPTIHPYAEMMKEANLGVLICGDITLEETPEYIALDCSAATENLLLAAHALGLGAVWLGVYPRKDRMKNLRKLFNLPDHIFPISLVSIGYPEEKIEYKDRYNSSRVHKNSW